MSFRTRLALVSAAAVAVAAVAASAAAYFLVRDTLRDEVDGALLAQADRRRPGGIPALRPPAFGGPPGYAQVLTADGRTLRPRGASRPLPVSEGALAVARGERSRSFDDAEADDVHLRVLSVPLDDGSALQIARPLDEVDATLSRLRLALLGVAGAGVALAALLGLAVSRAAIGPLRRLTETAEEVTRTHDLSRRVGVDGDDEIGRLSAQFDAMLGELAASEQAQRQLVADASHELRTPITAVRASVDLLARHDDLPSEERGAALAVARGQLEELSALVTDIVDLARDGAEPAAALEALRLDEIVVAAVESARRAAPSITFEVTAEPTIVDGLRDRAARAVSNLLDNAVKWSPQDGAVEVTVRDGTVSVRDHGPGFADSDLPRVFERFYRADAARGTPGSGLGLAIVRQVAELHGGSVEAANAAGGGAVVRLTLSATS